VGNALVGNALGVVTVMYAHLVIVSQASLLPFLSLSCSFCSKCISSQGGWFPHTGPHECGTKVSNPLLDHLHHHLHHHLHLLHLGCEARGRFIGYVVVLLLVVSVVWVNPSVYVFVSLLCSLSSDPPPSKHDTPHVPAYAHTHIAHTHAHTRTRTRKHTCHR